MMGFIQYIDSEWVVQEGTEQYPVHPTQSHLLSHDISYKKVKAEDIIGRLVSFELQFNPVRGPWLYAWLEGFKSTLDYDTEW